MTRANAISLAVQRVEETRFTFYILRRGYKYDVQISSYGPRIGWKIVEMIGPGNIHNYQEHDSSTCTRVPCG